MGTPPLRYDCQAGRADSLRFVGAGGRCAIDALLVALIWLLVYAVLIAVVCWIVARLLAQFFPAAAGLTWVVWAIGGLVLLLLIVRLLVPALPG